MKLRGMFLLAGVMFALPAMAKVGVQMCDPFPVPPRTRVVSVAPEMDFNGIPMALQRMEAEESVDSVLAFYRRTWAARGEERGAIEYPLQGWRVVAVLRGKCFYTAQVRSFGRGGAEALLGITAPGGDAPVVRDAIPMLSGSTVLNDIGHYDAGKTARTLVIKNGYTPEANAEYYERVLGGTGWVVTNRHRIDRPRQQAMVVILRNGVRELTFTATRDGQQSNVVLNFVDQS